MKDLLIFPVLLWSIAATAQEADFAPVGARWWINQIVLKEPFSVPADSFVIAEVTHEEMKAGELCRVITNLSGCGLPNPAHVFTRHDSVFFFSEVTEQFELLYDFTATVGSTWTVRGLLHSAVGDVVVNITDVREVELFGRVYKTWFMPFTEQWGHWIVEKAGSLWYPGPTPPLHCQGGGGKKDYAPHMVRCYEENGELYKFTTTECDWHDDISGISGPALLRDIKISPNPVSALLHISLPENAVDGGAVSMSVYTASGSHIYSASLTQSLTEVDITAYKPGVYYIFFKKNGVPADVQKVIVGR